MLLTGVGSFMSAVDFSTVGMATKTAVLKNIFKKGMVSLIKNIAKTSVTIGTDKIIKLIHDHVLNKYLF